MPDSREQFNNRNYLEKSVSHSELSSHIWNEKRNGRLYLSLGKEETIPADTVVLKADTIPGFCLYVISGKIISYEYTQNGEERVYAVTEEGSLLFEDAVLFQHRIPIGFKTVGAVKAVRILRADLEHALFRDPDLAYDIIHSVSDKLLSAMEQLRQVNNFNAPWRICNLLLAFAHSHGVEYDGKILIQEKISQKHLSNILGLNRITTVRAIKDLKDMGLIEQINGYYCIRSIEKLQRHMDNVSFK